ALDRVRREVLRPAPRARGAHDPAGARVLVADLVHALTRGRNEPLLHFAVLGIGLFALYSLVSDGGESAGSEELVVDAPRIAALADQFVRSWRRAPTQAELDGLIESYVRDEVLYREGLALGLDRDDAVIRSRVRLK